MDDNEKKSNNEVLEGQVINGSKNSIKLKKKRRGFWFLVFALVTGIYLKVVYRVKVIGKENIPKDKAIIFCGNHRSFLDAPLIACTSKENMRFLAKQELTKSKFLALTGKVANVIYVSRDAKDMTAVKTTLKTLKSGNNIAIFPEGTRNGLEKGEKVKDGVAFFALNTDAYVVPVGIKGGEKPFKRITVTYGKPIDLEKYKESKKEKETIEKVTELIMNTIISLSK